MIEIKIRQLTYNEFFQLRNRNDTTFNLPHDFFDWEHYQNVYGPSIFISTWDDDKVIGTEILQLLNLKLGKITIKSAIAVESFTDPKYRGQGIWPKMVLKSQEIAKEKEIGLIWGFPNEVSKPILAAKLNWKYHSSLTKLIRFISSTPNEGYKLHLISTLLKSKRTRNGYIRKSNNIIDLNTFLNMYEWQNNAISIDDIKNYYEWRYKKYPQKNKINNIRVDEQGTIIGLDNEVISNNSLKILSIYSAKDNIKLIINSIIKEAIQMKTFNIELVCNPNSIIYQDAITNGFHVKSKHELWINPLNSDIIDILENSWWDLQMGDEDITYCRPFPN